MSSPLFSSPDEDAWTPPDVEAELQTRIGGSFVDEFVLGHSPADILRELVQNEFDAGGHAMTVSFGRAALTVSGTGNPVTKDGWPRLSVIAGTGRTVGEGADGGSIGGKVNGIGSKNFGLRSLFLYGDRIHLRSAGEVAVLDLPKLATARVRDEHSMGRRGVTLYIPYRLAPSGKLPAFTLTDEEEAFASMSGAMLATLAKLATPGRKKGLRELVLRSERLDRTVRWTQRVSEVDCRIAGVDALKRTGRMEVNQGEIALPRQTFDEIEFGQSVEIPDDFAGLPLPEYFRRPRHKIRIAVSLPLERGRPKLHSGRYFYPLQAHRGGTGTSIDVSAPFGLNSDRSALLPGKWNDWLCKQAAAFVVRLLTGDWHARYGTGIYSALLHREPTEPDAFRVELDRLLSTEACWPTASTTPRERFAQAEGLAIPSDPLLAPHLPPLQRLADDFTSSEYLAQLAVSAGAKRFTLNSLIRRRCAAKGQAGLETTLADDEADLPFDDYHAAMTSLEVQVAMADTLTQLHRRLSPSNRQDLRESPSTLTKSTELRPATSLVRVDPEIRSCPQPPGEQLHPALFEKRSISSLCTPFDEEKWMRLVCERAKVGKADDEQLLAVETRILSSDRKLGRAIIAALKSSPVFRDHRGEWVSPSNMRLIKGRANAFFLNALSAPSASLAKNEDLTAILRIPEELCGDDMVTTAEWVVAHPDTAPKFEAELDRRLQLLSRPIAKRLRSIHFLPTATGTLGAPQLLHEANDLNRLCVPEEWIVGSHRRMLHERLGVRPTPDPKAVIQTLEMLKTAGQEPPSPENFYALVARVASDDPQFLQELSSRPIIWVDGAYHPASDVVAGSLVTYTLDGIVPVVRGPHRLIQAFNALGAASSPREHHWQRFFQQIGQGTASDAPVDDRIRRRLLDAYAQRGSTGLPAGIEGSVACLLDRRGQLHAFKSIADGTLVENDFGGLADAVDAGNIGIGIADLNERSAAFFGALGLQRLTDIAGAGQVAFGASAAAARWFGEDQRRQLLADLKQPMMSEAIHRLATHHWRDVSVGSFDAFALRLGSISRIEVFDRIEREYTLGGGRVSVVVEVGIAGDVLGTTRPRTWLDIRQLLAQALAEIVGHVDIADVRQFAALMVPLLMCQKQRDIDVFLGRQGIVGLDPLGDLDDDATDEKAADEEAARTAREELVEDAFSDILDNVMSRKAAPSEPPAVLPKPTLPQPIPAPLPPAPPPRSFALPAFDEICIGEPKLSGATLEPKKMGGRGPGFGYGYSAYRPPSPEDTARDQLVGERGEEIVYNLELERVRALGHDRPEEHVVWVSRSNPGADHDIQSIDEDGQTVWIEVKATTGSDGRFMWSKREFEKAVAEGEHYLLCRVYLAASGEPKVKRFRNPVALLRSRQMLLDLNELRADVEPL